MKLKIFAAKKDCIIFQMCKLWVQLQTWMYFKNSYFETKGGQTMFCGCCKFNNLLNFY
jgi:hypothetical protein